MKIYNILPFGSNKNIDFAPQVKLIIILKTQFIKTCICIAVFLYISHILKSQNPELIFQSGFEGSTTVVTDVGTNDYGAPFEHIEGVDTSLGTKNNWTTDWAAFKSGGNLQIQYTGGDSTKRFAKVETDPVNPNNKVLHYLLNDSWLASEGQIKARIQTNIYGINTGLKEFYQSVRVFIPEDFNALRDYPARITWCTISEFWNNEWWVSGEPYGFRISLGIGKPSFATSDLNFILNAENAGQIEVWNANTNPTKVPIGKWFRMDYYFKEGNQETGRFWMSITVDGQPTQLVYDVHNFTHNTTDPAPNGLTGYNPLKLYTGSYYLDYVKAKGKTLQIYWDDFKLWKNKVPDISSAIPTINENSKIKIIPFNGASTMSSSRNIISPPEY